ncbi:L,D-transpeptidase [Pseudonocardia eucalypti]|uniref:L,D-transpeptidase n=1 Tax=Pseudonocardia eucalypti TaxID=648755 RepID=UPI0031E6627D
MLSGVLGLCVVAGGYLAAPASAAPAKPSALPPLAPGTPCTMSARSCVDLDTERAWLIKDGKVIRGPVKVSSGGRGKPTPVGHSLRVYRKEKDYKSQESRIQSGPKKGQPAPMPYSVFFEDGGIAFHSGNPAVASAGCVHLNTADAVAWFNDLQIGDQVQVVRASRESADRKKGVSEPQQPSNITLAPGQIPSGNDDSGDDDSDDSDGDSDGDS